MGHLRYPGGHLALSIYTTVPDPWITQTTVSGSQGETHWDGSLEYLGCFEDVRVGRILTDVTEYSLAMTPRKCRAFCEDISATLYGLEEGQG